MQTAVEGSNLRLSRNDIIDLVNEALDNLEAADE
jgi:hypothetical protein